MTVMFGTFYSFGIFFKPVINEFGWDRATISGAYSLCRFLTGPLGLIVGKFNDRIGPRGFLTAGGILYGAGFLLMSLIGEIWQFYFLYGVVIALGMSASMLPLIVLPARWFIKKRAFMTGLIISGAGLGPVIMAPLSNFLIATFGWRESYLIMGIVSLFCIVVAAQFLRLNPRKMGLKPYGYGEAVNTKVLDRDLEGFDLREAFRTWQFWALGVLGLCFNFALEIIIVHIVPHAIEVGITAASAAFISSIIGATSITGRLGMGGMTDRFGARVTGIIGYSLLITSFVWLLTAQNLWLLYIFAIIFGFSYGTLAVFQTMMTTELFGLNSYPLISGALGFINVLGAIAPSIAGRIYDATGSYLPAFWACLSLSVLGLIIILMMKPVKHRRVKEQVTGESE